jgi:hypothetical protein
MNAPIAAPSGPARAVPNAPKTESDQLVGQLVAEKGADGAAERGGASDVGENSSSCRGAIHQVGDDRVDDGSGRGAEQFPGEAVHAERVDEFGGEEGRHRADARRLEVGEKGRTQVVEGGMDDLVDRMTAYRTVQNLSERMADCLERGRGDHSSQLVVAGEHVSELLAEDRSGIGEIDKLAGPDLDLG